MAKYKVIFRSDNKNADTAPGWEPGCPVLINAVQVSRNTETGQCYLQLKLSNLTDVVIGRFALRAEVTYADGSTEAVELKPLDSDIQPGRAYRPDAVLLAGSDVQHVSARIVSATYGNEQWMSAGKVCANTAGGHLDLDQATTAERDRLLADLGKSPEKYRHHMVQGDDWWICSCGMPNVRKDQCICGLARKAVEQLEDEGYLNAAAAEREATEKKARAKRKRRRIIAAVAATIALVIAVGATGAIAAILSDETYQAYQAAASLEDTGSYKTAHDRFIELKDYRDSADRARECARLAAERAASVGDYIDAERWYGKAGETELQQEAAAMIDKE
ncbi:hypothetical protein [Adlercreutzia mucosicola]|uniref:hypothetical protein n=1 Tax=Adlercreutzia mucosicola TaxID=580026 RepID=UPI000404BBAD|nr:hypothetical protein [Adlercreutzia mucosicola]MCR2035952.1 hypothetical protein [Adlercreutzia mucosicola]